MLKLLRPWKKKVAYWYIARSLRNEPPRQVPAVKLKSSPLRIVILVDGSERALVDLAQRMQGEYTSHGSIVRSVFHFSDHEVHPGFEGLSFLETDLHWKGIPASLMKEWLGQDKCDLLLCLAGDQCLPILLMASRWNADVKVGMQASWPFFDIVLEGHKPPYGNFSAHLTSIFQTMKPSAHEQA